MDGSIPLVFFFSLFPFGCICSFVILFGPLHDIPPQWRSPNP